MCICFSDKLPIIEVDYLVTKKVLSAFLYFILPFEMPGFLFTKAATFSPFIYLEVYISNCFCFLRKSWIHGSVYRKRLRRTISIAYVIVEEGSCCWKINDRRGNFHEFSRGQEGIPRISRVKRVSAYDC